MSLPYSYPKSLAIGTANSPCPIASLSRVPAKRILKVNSDGTGAVMIDGKMQDDATFRQAKVIVDLAKLVAAKDRSRAGLYEL